MIFLGGKKYMFWSTKSLLGKKSVFGRKKSFVGKKYFVSKNHFWVKYFFRQTYGEIFTKNKFIFLVVKLRRRMEPA